MSTFAITPVQITIEEHPNADSLEIARVEGYQCVVGKGQWRTGDWALYIPEQAVLPDPLIEEMGLTGLLAGKEKNRVKAIRLRGQISQGLLYSPSEIDGAALAEREWDKELGIVKWVPPIPAHLAGETVPCPDIRSYTEIENIKRYPDAFKPGELVVATEKIHGTCSIYYFDGTELFVSSKGMAKRGLALVDVKREDGKSLNAYWRAAHDNLLADKLKALWEEFPENQREPVTLYGEVYGVQDLKYGKQYGELGFAVFDIRKGDDYVAPDTCSAWCKVLELPEVPVLYRGKFDMKKLVEVAAGTETISGKSEHVREGVVIKPVVPRTDDTVGGRLVLKLVNDAYLFRKGDDATEYE